MMNVWGTLSLVSQPWHGEVNSWLKVKDHNWGQSLHEEFFGPTFYPCAVFVVVTLYYYYCFYTNKNITYTPFSQFLHELTDLEWL